MRKKLVVIWSIIIFSFLLLQCTLPTASSKNETETDDTFESVPNLELPSSRNEDYINFTLPDKTIITLQEPALCQGDWELLSVITLENGLQKLSFQNNGEISASGEYIAQITTEDEEKSELFICTLSTDNPNKLDCVGNSLRSGENVKVSFGQVDPNITKGLMDGIGNLSELWVSKNTTLKDSFNFFLAQEAADLLGLDLEVNTLEDAYSVAEACTAVREYPDGTYYPGETWYPGHDWYSADEYFPGHKWKEPCQKLLSAIPQYDQRGLCDNFWECAQACAGTINFDLNRNNMVQGYEFYSKIRKTAGGILPEACQAFNSFTAIAPPRPGTLLAAKYEWTEVTLERVDGLDFVNQYEPIKPGPIVPERVRQCAERIDWPLNQELGMEFIEYYFSWLTQHNFIYYDCEHPETLNWIQETIDNFNGNESIENSSIIECANSMGWPGESQQDLNPVTFTDWYLNLVSEFPTAMTAECTSIWNPDVLDDLKRWKNNYLAEQQRQQDEYLAEFGLKGDCSTETVDLVTQWRGWFSNKQYDCESQGNGVCSDYDAGCQEDAFIASLLRDGTISGYENGCRVKTPDSCYETYQRRTPYVPLDVWQCAIDACAISFFPLNLGTGVHLMATLLEDPVDPDSIPLTCKTPSVVEWVEINSGCATQDDSSEWNGSSCGPYYTPGSGYTDGTESGWTCSGCLSVFQCAEGIESELCNNLQEDTGYLANQNNCAEQIGWDEPINTYQDGANLVNYLISAAPFLHIDDFPEICKAVVGQTVPIGMSYGTFLNDVVIGGIVEGSSSCSELMEFKIPEVATKNRCALFENEENSLVVLDIVPNTSTPTLYLSMPDGVPGVEVDVPDDEDSWEYRASLGNITANNCKYLGYKGRLYCSFNLPSNYINSVRSLEIYVNGCDQPIFTDPNVSLTSDSGSGGNNSKGGNEGGGGGGGGSCQPDGTFCPLGGGLWGVIENCVCTVVN